MLDWRRHGSEHPSGFLRLKAFQPRTHSSNPCSLADIVFLMPQCCVGAMAQWQRARLYPTGGGRFKSFWPYSLSHSFLPSAHGRIEETVFSAASCSSYLRILCQQESLELSDCNSAEWSGATKNSWASVSNGPFKIRLPEHSYPQFGEFGVPLFSLKREPPNPDQINHEGR